jgi:methionine-S-sulfoxide reductase
MSKGKSKNENTNLENQIILAGGCFWGVEEYFSRIKGITKTECVYVDGNIDNPKYEQLKKGEATHAEGVLLLWDNSISLNKILDYYFEIIDPYSLNKQGEDTGIQYRTGIYSFSSFINFEIKQYVNNKFKDHVSDVKVEIKVNPSYWSAEERHQYYLKKNPDGYCHISFSSIKEEDAK